jgi:multiple sugar transport system substrate-binding protein
MEEIVLKKLVLLLSMVALLGVATLWAGGEAETAAKGEPVISATAAGNPNAPIKLKGMIGAWNTMASTVEDRVAFYERQLKKWAAKHPDVYVEIELIPGGTTPQAMTKLLNAAIAGDPYDFANVDSQWLGNFHEAGVLQAIDAYVTEIEKNQYFDFTKMVTQREGKQYGFWAETGTLLFYYNTKYADKAPRTWADIFALNEKLDAEGAEVAAFLTQGKAAAAAFTLLPMFWAEGGVLFDPNQGYKPVFGEGSNRKAMVDTLNFYKELIDTGAMPPEIVGWEHKELAAEAAADNVATMIAGSWIAGGLGEEWNYASLPSKSGKHSNIYGGWTFSFMSPDVKKLEESVNFIQEVYTSRDAMAERLPLHGYIPTRKDVFEAPAFKSPLYDQIYKELEVGRARPATSLYPEVESLIEEAVGKVVAGNGDVEAIIDQMYKKVMNKYEDM